MSGMNNMTLLRSLILDDENQAINIMLLRSLMDVGHFPTASRVGKSGLPRLFSLSLSEEICIFALYLYPSLAVTCSLRNR